MRRLIDRIYRAMIAGTLDELRTHGEYSTSDVSDAIATAALTIAAEQHARQHAIDTDEEAVALFRCALRMRRDAIARGEA